MHDLAHEGEHCVGCIASPLGDALRIETAKPDLSCDGSAVEVEVAKTLPKTVLSTTNIFGV